MENQSQNQNLEARIKDLIVNSIFVTKDEERIISTRWNESQWIFDFRRVILKAEVLNDVSEIFWQKAKTLGKFQVGGLEVAAIPLVSGLVMKSNEKRDPVNGFFIRKSRKKDGLTKMIEGEITDEKIVLVDDLINTGKSFIRQIEIIESLGKKVSMVLVALRFRDEEYYQYFKEKNIEVVSLMTLDDLGDKIPVSNRVDRWKKPTPMPFNVKWFYKAEKPNYHHVMPKSAPVLDDNNIYFGIDDGHFLALNQETGKEVWRYRVSLGSSSKKYIFSSPVIYKDLVYFGAYDGNVYALDKNNGKKKWIFMEADWVGSSPTVAEDLRLLFIGEEFGLWKKKGGLVALDLKTGEKKWAYREMKSFVHCTPLYIKELGLVFAGSNEGIFYAFDAKSGKLIWDFKTGYEEGSEIRGGIAYDYQRGYVMFGSFDDGFYFLKGETGRFINRFVAEYPIYCTPLIVGDSVIFTSTDKNIYSLNLDSFDLDWKFATNGRVFASPVLINDKIYCGSNDGRMYEIDPKTGKETAFFQSLERITNKVVYNERTGTFFLPTFANEIYCLKKQSDSSKNL